MSIIGKADARLNPRPSRAAHCKVFRPLTTEPWIKVKTVAFRLASTNPRRPTRRLLQSRLYSVQSSHNRFVIRMTSNRSKTWNPVNENFQADQRRKNPAEKLDQRGQSSNRGLGWTAPTWMRKIDSTYMRTAVSSGALTTAKSGF
jgi:hypothetical protein